MSSLLHIFFRLFVARLMLLTIFEEVMNNSHKCKVTSESGNFTMCTLHSITSWVNSISVSFKNYNQNSVDIENTLKVQTVIMYSI
jgi:hypothetical protein